MRQRPYPREATAGQEHRLNCSTGDFSFHHQRASGTGRRSRGATGPAVTLTVTLTPGVRWFQANFDPVSMSEFLQKRLVSNPFTCASTSHPSSASSARRGVRSTGRIIRNQLSESPELAARFRSGHRAWDRIRPRSAGPDKACRWFHSRLSAEARGIPSVALGKGSLSLPN
jgi:hypothetical protein